MLSCKESGFLFVILRVRKDFGYIFINTYLTPLKTMVSDNVLKAAIISNCTFSYFSQAVREFYGDEGIATLEYISSNFSQAVREINGFERCTVFECIPVDSLNVIVELYGSQGSTALEYFGTNHRHAIRKFYGDEGSAAIETSIFDFT